MYVKNYTPNKADTQKRSAEEKAGLHIDKAFKEEPGGIEVFYKSSIILHKFQ